MMAQMLSTFSSLEQSRFQAYKRSCFAANAIEAWVAACLEDRYGGGVSDPPRPLPDLVATGQAQEIGLVVAMAAKIYAQRLVAEAVAMQEKGKQQEIQAQQNAAASGNGSAFSVHTAPARFVGSEPGTALQCTAVWEAVQERRRRGADPGFFLQPAEGRWNWAARAATLQHYDVRRLAAMAAEEEYDQRRREGNGRAVEGSNGDEMDVDKAASPKARQQERHETLKGDGGNDEMSKDTDQLLNTKNDSNDFRDTIDDPLAADEAKATPPDAKPDDL
jgi:hypothetical protein